MGPGGTTGYRTEERSKEKQNDKLGLKGEERGLQTGQVKASERVKTDQKEHGQSSRIDALFTLFSQL